MQPDNDWGLTPRQEEEVHEIIQTSPIHPNRWKAITVWILCFTALMIFLTHKATDLAHKNNDTIRDLVATKASIDELEKTNCGLKVFLLTARRVRFDSLKQDRNEADRKADRDAITGYTALAHKFSAIDGCKIPNRLLLPQDKKGH